MTNITFKKKLIIFAGVVGIIPLLMMALITYKSAADGLEDSIYRGNEVFLENSMAKIDEFFLERIQDTQVLSNSGDVLDALQSPNRSTITQGNTFLMHVKEAYGYSDLFVTDTEGTIVISDDESIVGADLSGRSYVSKSLTGQVNWSPLIYSSIAEHNVMVVSAPIKVDTNIIGTIGIVISQETINDLIHSGVKALGDSGDSYLVNGDKLLYSETMLGDYTQEAALIESVNSEGTRMLAAAIADNDASFVSVGTYDDYLDNPVLGALGVSKLGDELVGLVIEVDVSEAMAPVVRIRNMMVVIVIVTLVLIIFTALIIIKSIIKPVKNVNAMLKDIGDGEGDLTKRLHITSKDEFGLLADLFNNFVGKIQAMVGGISENATTLASSSVEISASIESSNTSLEDISRQTNDMNVSITNNASVLEETNASLEEIASSANVISTKAEEVTMLSSDALKATKVGASNLNIASESVLKVQDSSQEMEAVIKNLSDSSNEIGGIISIISGISEQTNLLALNAAIEAARAGEQGRGFAVVADEVRKLAEETKVSAESITDLVGRLITESNRALASVENEKHQVHESVDNIRKSSVEFDNILRKIDGVSDLMDNISSMVNNQTHVTDEIAKAMTEITTTTVESATAVNEISANVESQAAMFEQISASVEDLSSTAEALDHETKKFKV